MDTNAPKSATLGGGDRTLTFKFFSPDPEKRLRITNLRDWPTIWKNGHRAVWNRKNYDMWLDSDVKHARHALSIDEQRKDFPRVKWAMRAEAKKTIGRKPAWLKQVWFAGCHSDVGGSYLEPESRLSDISLDWMVEELQECVPEVQIDDEMLVRSPDSLGMQHEETFMFKLGIFKRRWKVKPRKVGKVFKLHPSVLERLEAEAVSHVGELKPYRPEQLKEHPEAEKYY